ncbi:MAG: DUF4301 family protein [Deltaproteobacteria bacterium]|nr:DUF4301 family protein [Deltaproteobacteria bacterium]
MGRIHLTDDDLKQIKAHGLEVEQVNENIGSFEKGVAHADIDRPCTVGDGIVKLDEKAAGSYAQIFESCAKKRGVTQFVPASGAASRMFKALLKLSAAHGAIKKSEIARLAHSKGSEYSEALIFVENLSGFAFYPALCEKMRKSGLDPATEMAAGDYTHFISFLLFAKGLGYNGCPKGLIKFHKYPDGPRTPFEEHLVEASRYAKGKDGVCHLHFTVSSGHKRRFETYFNVIRNKYENAGNVVFDVGFSIQSPATDTLAVDIENKPFRNSDGRLVFRPGGHGSLIENLSALNGDLIFIKNIDNVVTDQGKDLTVFWKKVLAGYLLAIEERVFIYLDRLRNEPVNDGTMNWALNCAQEALCVDLPSEIYEFPAEKKREFLIRQLNRPIRVCGMVERTGEPGGGPFWVRQKDGSSSIQIVETAQIDLSSESQKEKLDRLTHFNPVDIVASVRDRNGNPFNLTQFVDHDAVFIAEKSMDGREMRALERPGLWNGSMAFWNTFFVEVPVETFNPVKTVNDLLRDAHL